MFHLGRKFVIAILICAWSVQANAWVKFCEELDGRDTGCDFNRMGSSGEKSKQLAVYHCKGKGSVADAVRVANACVANRNRNLSAMKMWSLSCATLDPAKTSDYSKWVIQGKDGKAWVALICTEGYFGPDGRSIQ